MGRQEKAASAKVPVRLSNNALQNIDEITGYIAFINHQPQNALKVGDALFATIERIGRNPLAFKICEEIQNKTKAYRQAVSFHSLSFIK